MKVMVDRLLKKLLVWILLLFIVLRLGAARADSYERDKYIDSPFGINNPYNKEGIDVKRYLNDIGVHWVKMSFRRAKIEQSKGQYRWSSTDREVDAIYINGKTNIIGVINPFTEWDTAGGVVSAQRIKKGKIQAKYYVGDWESYERYVKALLNRYKDRIKYWMIFNEPEEEYHNRLDEYIKLVKVTSTIIKNTDPKAKIILGGFTENPKYMPFREQLLKKLSEYKEQKGFFDILDYHTYFFAGPGPGYRQTEKKGSLITHQSYLSLSKKTGFAGKPVWICEGATHSGGDKKIKLPYQSEKDQAIFLVKRFFYAISEGVEKVFWSTIREHEKYLGTIHIQFTLAGLVYNGVPKEGQCDGQLPCPDPGDGVKKLSYYTYKQLVEKFEGSDWKNIKRIEIAKNVYLFKVKKNNKPIYCLWRDNFNNTESVKKQVELKLAVPSRPTITEAVPKGDSGLSLSESDYPRFFANKNFETKGNRLKIDLDETPVYVEGVELKVD